MQKDVKTPTPLFSGLLIFLGFIFSIAVTGLVGAILMNWAKNQDGLSPGLISKLSLVFGELGLWAFVILFLKFRGYLLKDLFRFRSVPLPVILVSIPLGVSLSIVGDQLDRLIQLIVPMPGMVEKLVEFFKFQSHFELAIMILGAVVLASVVEESLFRGLLQISLEKYIPVTRAVIYSSLAWAFIHGILYWAIQIFLIGVILGYLAWRTNSVVPSMIGHAINNTLALIFYNINVPETFPAYEWKGQVSPVILLPAIFILYWGIRYLDQIYQRGMPSSSPPTS
ncbi:MAG: CPBP family intramembrane metalloprotease [Calditrichaeota bacterium]|nr:CPBP family intramembrane metalloprotease [Calditrichota bacterium]